jgi:hypothetical protein
LKEEINILKEKIKQLENKNNPQVLVLKIIYLLGKEASLRTN